METDLFRITFFGILIYSVYVATTIWILVKKEFKWISVVFPIIALTEGLFIDWRWNQLQNFDGVYQIVLGGLPSFLIAIGFPFIGFYLHHFLPSKVRLYLRNTDLFPFSSERLKEADFQKYFTRGFIYSFSTLILHELSQTLHISSRNTFDLIDIVFILIGSVLSVVVYRIFKIAYNTNSD
ncbi:hypothetical protein Aoki45_12640 [Algoriphagus sp. oki45]|uniref:hypothetical protein n=1 Tax=Algoriphagus sp. oki45 TaxID=3067294 RepID=UPI0028000E58|nr:hypothetical protein Aoki45_12640 [Algoriphagus sp. oki45]